MAKYVRMWGVDGLQIAYAGGMEDITGSMLLALPRKAGRAMGLLSTPFSTAVPTYSPEEWSALQRLRARYQQNPDLWTERELAHLRFLRWLVQSGWLVEDGGPAAADDDARATVR
jgi:hypothetical protein